MIHPIDPTDIPQRQQSGLVVGVRREEKGQSKFFLVSSTNHEYPHLQTCKRPTRKGNQRIKGVWKESALDSGQEKG
jgi:hypothetical protein